MYCGDSCGAMSYSRWAAALAVVQLLASQTPGLGALAAATLVVCAATLFWAAVAVVLPFTSPREEPSYALPPGSASARAFSALNALGVVVFQFGNSLAPEMFATLAPSPATAATARRLRRATTAAFALIAPLYMAVACAGYAAYGAAAPDSILYAPGLAPAALVAAIDVIAAAQLLVGQIVYNLVLYEAVEATILARWPAAAWMRRRARGGHLAPSRALTAVARTPFVAASLGVALLFPSAFTGVMGFVGAATLSATTYVFPAALYWAARRSELPAWRRWALLAFAAGWAATGAAAAVGSVWAIVETF